MQNDLHNSNLGNEVVDLEDYAKKGKTPPKGHKYKIKIDRENYTVDKECMTGAEILAEAGKTPEKFMLRQIFSNGNVITIQPEQVVCFTEPGIEKFKTLANDHTEGEAPRRGFPLLEEDEAYLNHLGLKWESIVEGDNRWILIYEYPIVEGYNTDKATIAVRIAANYPDVQLDMLYFYPPLSRKDGVPINRLSPLSIDGKSFQQWSRHRTQANPWRPGIDDLSTHVALADMWLSKEFNNNVAV